LNHVWSKCPKSTNPATQEIAKISLEKWLRENAGI
jgi:hypothetical protein